jgi:hypothetical protein
LFVISKEDRNVACAEVLCVAYDNGGEVVGTDETRRLEEASQGTRSILLS